MLLEKTLATLAYRVTQHLPLALAGLVLVVGAAFWLCEKVHTASRWVVRRGPARAVAVRYLAPRRSITTSLGWTAYAPKVPICV